MEEIWTVTDNGTTAQVLVLKEFHSKNFRILSDDTVALSPGKEVLLKKFKYLLENPRTLKAPRITITSHLHYTVDLSSFDLDWK
jgi:hypothetical protein